MFVFQCIILQGPVPTTTALMLLLEGSWPGGSSSRTRGTKPRPQPSAEHLHELVLIGYTYRPIKTVPVFS